jgi:hypothetical protein
MDVHSVVTPIIIMASLGAICQAQPPILRLDFETDNPALALHNGAAVVDSDGGRALALDGAREQYAAISVPAALAALGGVRLEARVRLEKASAGQVPIGRPGSCMIYVDGGCRPRALAWAADGRRIGWESDEPLGLGQWHHLVFDYRDDGYAVLLTDGKIVAMGLAQGPLRDTGRDWEIGRYEWEENGALHYSYLTGQISDVIVSAPEEGLQLPDLGRVKIVQASSWGDSIMFGADDSREKIRATLEAAKRRAVSQVQWRVSSAYLREYYQFVPEDMQSQFVRDYLRKVEDIYREFDYLAYGIEQCHDLGMKCYGWITIFDEGAPGAQGVQYADTSPFPWQSKFTKEHPYVCVVDRQGEPQWGVMEYAYPEARAYKVRMIVDYMTRYDFDGVFISTRSHSNPAMDGDRFGFNEPIVREFQERYGVNILEAPNFDKEAWRRLRGEQVTKLLRELRAAMPKGKRVSIGIPRGDYWGPPYGNLFIDWRTWVAEGLIDELCVGEITGKGLYPERKDYQGYVFDQEAGIGLRPLEDDMREVFGPPCKAHGVELYLQTSNPLSALPFLDDGLTGVRMY